MRRTSMGAMGAMGALASIGVGLVLACAPTSAVIPPQPVAEPSEQGEAVAAPPGPAKVEGDPVWADLCAEHPEALSFEPLSPVALPGWADEAKQLWIRHRGACRPITPDTADRKRGQLEVCAGKVNGADVRCEQRVELGDSLRIRSQQSCQAKFPDGSGAGSGSAGSHDPPGWQLVGWDEDSLVYAVTYALELEPASVTWVEAPCSADSLLELEAKLDAEGVLPADQARVMHEGYGVMKGRQRCQDFEGTRFEAHRVGERRWGDMGAGRRIVNTERDCTRPCPAPGDELRRYNEYLQGRRFRDQRDAEEVRLYRSVDACELDPGPGLAVGASDPCTGKWVSSGRP